MEAALIVAHPDDEIIWSGGLLLRNRGWRWTVLAVCRADDPDRRPKFDRISRSVGITGLISDLDDGNPLAEIDAQDEIGRRVLEHLGATEWDLCLTHGSNGEYGHERHRQVHQVVTALAGAGRLRCRRLWTFAYECDAATGACRAADWADMTLDLSQAELAEKKRLVRDEYGYDANGFEVRACVSPEGFLRLRGPSERMMLK